MPNLKNKKVIKDQQGQRKYPGRVTEIQGNTMATTGYGDIPLYVVPNVGNPMVVPANSGNRVFPGASSFTEYPIAKNGGWLEKYQDGGKTLEDNDSWLENIAEIADPTGISSWDDVYRAYKNKGIGKEVALELLGSIPLLGKVKKAGRLVDDLANAFAITKRQKNNAKITSGALKGIGKYGPSAGRVTDAVQTVLGSKDNSGFTSDIRHGEVPKYGGRNIFPQIELGEHGDYAYGGWLEQYGDGGDFNDYKRPGPVEDRSTGMTGMMKSKIATEAHYGNPSALRMVSPNPKTGMTPEGIGTHYMSSFDNYAVPLLQDKGNINLEYIKNPPISKEDIRFNSPEEAQYFAEHYKEVAPMMRNYKEYKNGGWLDTYEDGGEINGDDEHKKFLTNWYSNRKIQDSYIQEAFDLDKDSYIKNTKEYPNYTYVDSIRNDPHVTGNYDKDTNKILLTKDSPDHVKTHELNHFLNSKDGSGDYMRTIHKDIVKNELKPKSEASGVYKDKYDYFSEPDEVHSRIMVLREKAGFKPNENVTEEQLNSFLKTYKGDVDNINDIFELSKYKTSVLNMLNYMATNNNQNKNLRVAKYGGWLEQYAGGGEIDPPVNLRSASTQLASPVSTQAPKVQLNKTGWDWVKQKYENRQPSDWNMLMMDKSGSYVDSGVDPFSLMLTAPQQVIKAGIKGGKVLLDASKSNKIKPSTLQNVENNEYLNQLSTTLNLQRQGVKNKKIMQSFDDVDLGNDLTLRNNPSRVSNKEDIIGKNKSLVSVKNKKTNEYIDLKSWKDPNDGEIYYYMSANMPSSKIKAGKAYIELEKHIPKGKSLLENSSLSYDSFLNILKQTKNPKFESFVKGHISMNDMSVTNKLKSIGDKISDDLDLGFYNKEIADKAVNELNVLISKYNLPEAKVVQKTLHSQPAAHLPYESKKVFKIELPNVGLKKLYSIIGISAGSAALQNKQDNSQWLDKYK